MGERNNAGGVWSDALVAELKRLVTEDGMSAAKVAEQLGHGITRDQVTSKCGRLGISPGGTRCKAPGEWSEAETTLTKRLWAEGVSAAQIAKQLPGRSRCAVISRLDRLGVVGPSPQARSEAARINGSRPYLSEPRLPISAIPPPRPIPPDARRVTLLELEDDACRWVIQEGDGAGKPWLFCGAPKAGRSYCAYHQKPATSESIPGWLALPSDEQERVARRGHKLDLAA